MSLDSKINTLSILDIKGLTTEISRDEKCRLSYSYKFNVTRESPTAFIQDFLEAKGYEFVKLSGSNVFNHAKDYSTIIGVFNDTNEHSIRVSVEMNKPSQVSYAGDDFLNAYIANELLLRMFEVYGSK